MASIWPMMIFGEQEGGGPYTEDEKKRADTTFDHYKGLEELLDISDSYENIPNDTMRKILDASLQHAGNNGISNIYFGKDFEACWLGNEDFTTERDHLATCLIAKSISQNSAYNFNTTTNGKAAKKEWDRVIYGDNGINMGRGLLAQDMIENHNFKKFLDDKSHWLPLLEDILQNEVYIMGTLVKQLTSANSLPVKMKFFTLQRLGSTNLDTIASKWEDLSSKDLMKPVRDFIQTDNHLKFIRTWLDTDPYLNNVQNVCGKHSSHIEKVHHVGHNIIPCKHTVNVYGQDTENWMIQGSLQTYNLVAKLDGLANKNEVCPEAGCFLPGTLVHTELNEQVPIEQLEENDVILGAKGVKGIVSSEKCGITVDVEVAAFGFNEDKPFFLASHPFWSQDGWRALNPVAAREENPWLDVGELIQGDYVRRIKQSYSDHLEYEWVKINKISQQVYPAGTRFHGIHTREGPRSYHANGYLVFQNYPEITRKRVMDGIFRLPTQEQRNVMQRLKEFEPTLSKILGPGVARTVTSAAEKRVHDSIFGPSEKTSKSVPVKDFNTPEGTIEYASGSLHYGSYAFPTKACVLRGHLFLDGIAVQEKSISNDKAEISWCRRTPCGKWEHGYYKLYEHGFYGKGSIALTEKKNDSRSLTEEKIHVTYQACVFKTSRSVEEVDPENLPAFDTLTWKPFGKFAYGLQWEGDSESPDAFAAMKIKNVAPDWTNLLDSVQLYVEEDENLAILVDVDKTLQSIIKWVKFQGEFDIWYEQFEGYCTEFDGRPDFEGKTFGWKGKFKGMKEGEFDKDPPEKKREERIEMGRLQSLKDAIHKDGFGRSSTQNAAATHSNGLALHSVMCSSLKARLGLSLDELLSMPSPSSDNMHETTFNILTKYMKYNMDDNELENIFGIVRPTLEANEKEVADKYSEFFGTRFGTSYLMKALSESADLQSRFDQERKNKLLYYFAGNGEGCLAKDEEYILVNNELGRQAFLGLTPDLDKYIADGRDEWAKDFHAKLTTNKMLLSLATYANINSSNAIIQKHSMVLYCLAPDKGPEPEETDGRNAKNGDEEELQENYSSDFYIQVMMTKLNSNCDDIFGDESLEEEMLEIIGDIMLVVINMLLTGAFAEDQSDVCTKLREELQEMQEYFQTTTVEQLHAKMMAFVTATLQVSWEKVGNWWDRLFASGKISLGELDGWPTRILKGVVHIATFGFYAIAFFSVVGCFVGWDTLTAEQRTSLIFDCAYMGLSAFKNTGVAVLKTFWQCFRKGSPTVDWAIDFAKVKKDKGLIKGLKSMVKKGASAVAKEQLTLQEAVAKCAAGTGGDLATYELRWAKMFNFAKGVAKVTGVLASVAGAVAIGFQIARDIKNGVSPAIITFEVLEGACFAVSAFADLLSLVVTAEALPVLGQICAVVGLVISLVLLFVRDDQTDFRTPAEKWIDEEGGPYANDHLETPSDEWLNDYHEHHTDE